MISELDRFMEKFKVIDLTIYETDFWTLSLRPQQVTFGAGILSLKRECDMFSKLNDEELTDLGHIIKKIENPLKDILQYDKINYLMLMMVDKHVHFHVLPRYENQFELLGINWGDESWPGPPILLGKELDDQIIVDILNYIKGNINL